MKKNKVLFLVSALVTAALLWFVLSRVSPWEILETLRGADWRYLLTFLVFSVSMSIFSTWRYLELLKLAGFSVAKVPMFLVVLVRNLGSDLLPARLGTLVYVFLITNRLHVPLAPALSSFGYALVFDIFAMAPLVMLGAVFALGEENFSPYLFVAVGLGAFLTMGAMLLFLPRLLGWVLKCYGGKLPVKLRGLVTQIHEDIKHVSRAGALARILALSVAVRACKYLGLYSFLLALLVPKGYGDFSFAKAFLGMCAAEMSASLPISGIAGFGTYQGTWIAVFSLLGFPLDLATVTSVSHHLFTQAYGYSLGVGALLVLFLPIFKSAGAAVFSPAPGRLFALKFASALLLVAAFAFITSPRERRFPKYEVKGASDSYTLEQPLLFDSRRGKTFGIYQLERGKEARALIDSEEYHEVFPSSFGRKIVFARARGAGRYSASDIFIFDRESGAQALLSKNGTFPSFSADGKSVTFERERSKVIEVDLETGQEKELFPGELAAQWGGFEVVKPRISAGRKLAFTSDKGGRWSIWVAAPQDSKLQRIGDGCQPIFSSETELHFVMNKGAKSGAGVFKVDLNSLHVQAVLDRKGELGHEYFPFPFQRGVLFGASNPDQHDHESGPYQLFFFDGSSLKRLTNDNANSRWPSVPLATSF